MPEQECKNKVLFYMVAFNWCVEHDHLLWQSVKPEEYVPGKYLEVARDVDIAVLGVLHAHALLAQEENGGELNA